MFELDTLRRESDGLFHANDPQTDEDIIIDEMFPVSEWDCPEAFEFAHIKGYDPMTAKELDTEEAQVSAFDNPDNIIEEKFDGTRALVYFLSQQVFDPQENILIDEYTGYCRVFSRRISKKTGFYVENTDSLPHIRETDAPALGGTILDGEMFIDGLPFKEVSSTLNCLWDKAIDRQIEKGFITFHAFDILFYRGIDMRKFPLHKRKEYLHVVIEELQHPYIKEVSYHKCGLHSTFGFCYDEIADIVGVNNIDQFVDELEERQLTYPNLWLCFCNNLRLTPRAYYELVVSTGGEGVMIKPFDGKYYHKRGWEYSKIKKFLTRELIVLGFDEPTKEYTGKEIKKWAYWIEKSTDKRVMGNFYGDKNYEPVTKFYYYRQVGNLLLGVLVKREDYENIPDNKKGQIYDPSSVGLEDYDTDYVLMQVCECAGFDDDTRASFTNSRESLLGSVVEVKANEIFKDSGKLRHPRYMRQRFDKSAEECTWDSHVMR